MADIVLSDGREITFDLTKLTMREYAGLFDSSQPVDVDAAIIARVCGMTDEEYAALQKSETVTLYDWKKLHALFFKRCREPLLDPK